MYSDFFRRMILFSPEATSEVAEIGHISPATMRMIIGGMPETSVSSREEWNIRAREAEAATFGFINYAQGAGTAPNMTMGPKAKSTGQYLATTSGLSVPQTEGGTGRDPIPLPGFFGGGASRGRQSPGVTTSPIGETGGGMGGGGSIPGSGIGSNLPTHPNPLGPRLSMPSVPGFISDNAGTIGGMLGGAVAGLPGAIIGNQLGSRLSKGTAGEPFWDRLFGSASSKPKEQEH